MYKNSKELTPVHRSELPFPAQGVSNMGLTALREILFYHARRLRQQNARLKRVQVGHSFLRLFNKQKQ